MFLYVINTYKICCELDHERQADDHHILEDPPPLTWLEFLLQRLFLFYCHFTVCLSELTLHNITKLKVGEHRVNIYQNIIFDLISAQMSATT